MLDREQQHAARSRERQHHVQPFADRAALDVAAEPLGDGLGHEAALGEFRVTLGRVGRAEGQRDGTFAVRGEPGLEQRADRAGPAGRQQLEVGVVEPEERVGAASGGMLAAPRRPAPEEERVGACGGFEVADGEDDVVEALEHAPRIRETGRLSA